MTAGIVATLAILLLIFVLWCLFIAFVVNTGAQVGREIVRRGRHTATTTTTTTSEKP